MPPKMYVQDENTIDARSSMLPEVELTWCNNHRPLGYEPIKLSLDLVQLTPDLGLKMPLKFVPTLVPNVEEANHARFPRRFAPRKRACTLVLFVTQPIVVNVGSSQDCGCSSLRHPKINL